MDTDKSIDTSCGPTKSCKPRWLQRFSNVKIFLVVLTLMVMVQGFAVSGVNNANTIMYERRYQLTSRVTSLISVFYDVTAGVMGVGVGYYGASRHQPRIIAISILVFCTGLFIMCLAQFASPPYSPVQHSNGKNNSEFNMCAVDGNALSAGNEEVSQPTDVKNYVYLLIAGQMLNGYISACMYTLGVTFLEVSSSSANSAFYIGLLNAGTILGPGIGYLCGGALLNLYVDIPTSPPAGLTPADPAWVGAWWLGFVISMVLGLLLAFVMFLFPQEFPDTAAIRAAKVSEAHDAGVEDKVRKPGFGMRLKHLPKATWYLLKNSCYMCVTVTSSMEMGIMASIATFLPKILVVQFKVAPSLAATLAGVMAISSAFSGNIVSGWIIKKWDLKIGQLLKFGFICSVLAMCGLLGYLARCPDVKFAGVNSDYLSAEELERVNLSTTCNGGCGCTTALYDPVCFDNIQYFSPCHAGCIEKPDTLLDGTRVYHNCSCTADKRVISGSCEMKCPLLYGVMVPLGFLYCMLTMAMGMPMVITTLRVVPPQLRTYGLAVQNSLLRVFGSIPIPIIFGVVIDSSCIVWQDNNGEKGSCWVYDNQQLSIRLVGLMLAIKSVSVLFKFLAIVLYKPTQPKVNVSISVEEKESFMGNNSSADGK